MNIDIHRNPRLPLVRLLVDVTARKGPQLVRLPDLREVVCSTVKLQLWRHARRISANRRRRCRHRSRIECFSQTRQISNRRHCGHGPTLIIFVPQSRLIPVLQYTRSGIFPEWTARIGFSRPSLQRIFARRLRRHSSNQRSLFEKPFECLNVNDRYAAGGDLSTDDVVTVVCRRGRFFFKSNRICRQPSSRLSTWL